MNLSARFCLVSLLPALLLSAGCEDKGRNATNADLAKWELKAASIQPSNSFRSKEGVLHLVHLLSGQFRFICAVYADGQKSLVYDEVIDSAHYPMLLIGERYATSDSDMEKEFSIKKWKQESGGFPLQSAYKYPYTSASPLVSDMSVAESRWNRVSNSNSWVYCLDDNEEYRFKPMVVDKLKDSKLPGVTFFEITITAHDD